MRKIFSMVLFLIAALSCGAFADIAVTVYNNDRVLVKEIREVNLKNGVQTLEFDNVAAKIIATSVLPKFLTAPDKVRVLEQNFDYDLADAHKLLTKYIGKDIEIERAGKDKRKNISGKLLSVQGGIVVQSDEKIILSPSGEVSLPEMPEGIRLKPTLSWKIDSGYEGTEKMELSYQTSGISWNSDYVLVINESDTLADITGWVTINNKSGAIYKDAKLKLVAGDVNMVQKEKYFAANDRVYESAAASTGGANSFQERNFFEYHIYELQRKTTVKDNEIKQVELLGANNVPVNKVFRYNESQSRKVKVNLEFKNSKENNLGIPLPKGRVRVYKYDGASLEFIGEDMIAHTSKDAGISIFAGNAFDITGERTRIDYKSSPKASEKSYKIVLKNSKPEEVEVIVVEPMYEWGNWTIMQSSAEYEKKDSATVEFKVKVPANSEAVLTYKVKLWI